MAWHHIIPFSLLRDVWNRLVDQHIATQLAEARVAIRQYLLLCDRNQPNLDALIDRIRAESTDQKRAGHHHLQPLDVSEAHQLATAAVWPPWNAVEGPLRRSDDPQNRYFDRFTFGLTAEEAARMSAIETLFGHFRMFVSGGPAPGPGSLRALSQAASTARPILGCDLPIYYRAEMWVNDGAGMWRKRREAEPNTVPGQ
jgi:hypothetical protein